MKKLLPVLLLLISINSFAQVKVIKLHGTPGAYNFSKNAGGDSIIFYQAGVRNALSVGTVVDLSNYYNKTGVDNLLAAKVDTSYRDTINVGRYLYYDSINKTLNAHVSNDSAFINANDSTMPTTEAVVKYVGKNNIMTFVPDIPSLQSYGGSAVTVVVQDPVRGGTFNYVSSGLQTDNGVVFAATAKGSGYWVRLLAGQVFPEYWGTGTTTSRTFIQSALNYAAGKAIDVILRGNYNLDSSLIIGSNTTLILNKTARVNLNDSVSRTMLINRNAIAAGSPNIVDSNIIVSGGTWYGNGLKQNLYANGTGSAITTIFTLEGVKNLHISDVEFDSSRSYGMLISSYRDVYLERLRVNNSNTIFNRNLDGIHLNGPGINAFVNSCTFRGTDDQIAINATDVGGGDYYIVPSGGDIQNVIVTNCVLDSTLKFIRILPALNNVTNVVIANTTGTTVGNIIDVGDYGLGSGGKLSGLQITNTNVRVIQTVNQSRPAIHFFSGNFENLNISNTSVYGTHFSNPIIKVDSNVTINNLTIRDFSSTSIDTTSLSDFNIAGGSTTNINNFLIDGYKFKSVNKKTLSKIFDFSFKSNNLSVLNSSIDSSNVSLRLTNSTIKNLSLNNNFNVQSDSGTVIKSSTIDSLNLNGTYFKDAANLAFTKDAASTISSIITPVKLKQVNDATTSNPVQYKSNGVVYSIGTTQITVLPFTNVNAPQINYTGILNTGIYLGSGSMGFTSLGIPKFFFQDASNRGFVLSSDLPFCWAQGTAANGTVPDVYFTRTAAKELTLSSNQSTGIAKLKYASTPTYTASDNLTLVNAGSVPIINSGAGAPTSTPVKIGDDYLDLTNKKYYKAFGTSSSSDWIIQN